MAVDSGLPRADLEQRAIERLPSDIRRPFDSVDAALAGFMERYGITILRFALAVVFIWFGALKVVGESPVEDLVTDTVYWMDADFFIVFLGIWEIAIGIGLLLGVALRLVLLLFFAQMLGTFLTIVIHPGRVFEDGNPLLLTVTGEFIVKNLVLIAAGIVIGSTVRRGRAWR
jgi:putative oxidoreductase